MTILPSNANWLSHCHLRKNIVFLSLKLKESRHLPSDNIIPPLFLFLRSFTQYASLSLLLAQAFFFLVSLGLSLILFPLFLDFLFLCIIFFCLASTLFALHFLLSLIGCLLARFFPIICNQRRTKIASFAKLYYPYLFLYKTK